MVKWIFQVISHLVFIKSDFASNLSSSWKRWKVGRVITCLENKMNFFLNFLFLFKKDRNNIQDVLKIKILNFQTIFFFTKNFVSTLFNEFDKKHWAITNKSFYIILSCIYEIFYLFVFFFFIDNIGNWY